MRYKAGYQLDRKTKKLNSDRSGEYASNILKWYN